MNKNDRKSVSSTAKDYGYSQSSVDPNKMVNNSGSVIKAVGTNRTIIDGTTYYGASDAKNKIRK